MDDNNQDQLVRQLKAINNNIGCLIVLLIILLLTSVCGVMSRDI